MHCSIIKYLSGFLLGKRKEIKYFSCTTQWDNAHLMTKKISRTGR